MALLLSLRYGAPLLLPRVARCGLWPWQWRMAAPQLLPAEGRALRAMGHRNGYGNEAPLLPAHKPGTLGPAAMSRACVATAKVCSAVLSPSKSQLSASESDDKLTGCHPYKAKPSSGHSLLSKLKTYGLHRRVARRSFWPQGFR